MPGLANAWRFHLDRGPNWLFVRLLPDADEKGCDEAHLASRLGDLLDQHFTNRLVLELDGVELLSSLFLGQLVRLKKRIDTGGGVMRVCGLSPSNQDVLRLSRLDNRIPLFANRRDAVHGHRPPHKPR